MARRRRHARLCTLVVAAVTAVLVGTLLGHVALLEPTVPRPQSHILPTTGRRPLLGLGLGIPCIGPLACDATSASLRIFGGEILKSDFDPRTYRAATLSNGLRFLVISDPEATAAAGALCVHAGSYLDPDELPGLAHFCEHMLFLGTKEFPEENFFRTFLSSRGGSLNAFTEEQATTYFFDVSPGQLQPALQRFASFFKAPLFTESATGRELAAIEFEDAKNRQSDAFRLNQLSKSFAAQGHPQRKFSTGNLRTLQTEPQQRGLDTRAALLQYFNRYYDAGLMTLCVLGREPVEDLLGWIEDLFSGIPAHGEKNPSLAWRGINPYPSLRVGGQQQLVEAVPVLERRSLSVTWPIVFSSEAERQEWVRCKPHTYASALLGYEGVGSLLSMLKARGLVDGLVAGVTREDDNFAGFRVSMSVTEAGLQRREDVFGALYSVLRELQRGVPEHVLRECRELAEVRFRFRAKGGALNTALARAQEMQEAAGPEEYVAGAALLFEPEGRTVAQILRALLLQFTPERGLHVAISRAFVQSAALSERWYGTPYSLSPLPQETLRRWAEAPKLPGYSPPAPNPFLPRNFELVQPQVPLEQRAEAAAEPPTLLSENSRWRVFWKADRAFGTPKASVRVFIWLPQETVDEGAVPSRLWQLALLDRLAEPFYDAGVAGLGFDAQPSMEGLTLQVGGYSDRLPLLTERLLARARDFDGPSEAEFARALDLVRRELKSFDKQQPLQYAAYLSRLCLQSPEYSIEFLREQASRVTLAEARAFSAMLRDRRQEAYGQALLHGNLDKATAERLQASLDGLPFRALPRDRLTRSRLAQLPCGRESWILRPGLNPEDENNALWVQFYTGQSTDAVILTQLLESVLQAPFFGELRTRQQLGYIVQSQADRVNLVGRLTLALQSSVATPARLLDAVDGFLGGFRATLEALSEADLRAFKVALVEKTSKRDEQLGEEARRWWQEINHFQYDWRRREEESQSVLSITRERLLSFFDSVVARGGQGRRRLVSAVFAPGPGLEEALAAMQAKAEDRGADIVADPVAYRASLDSWPLQDRDPKASL